MSANDATWASYSADEGSVGADSEGIGDGTERIGTGVDLATSPRHVSTSDILWDDKLGGLISSGLYHDRT
jgi:hypothetical protein